MKQCITIEEWRALPSSSKGKWAEWCGRHHYFTPEPFGDWGDPQLASAPTIGMMIEFLDEHPSHDYHDSEDYYHHSRQVMTSDIGVFWCGDLCQELWKAVKEVLAEQI